MPQKPKSGQEKDHRDLEARHPNGTPRTIHSWEDGEPVYLDEVGGHSAEELKALGYSEDEIGEKAGKKEKKSKSTRE